MDISEIGDSEHKKDFRRANGAPQIIDHDGKNQRYSRPSGWGKDLDDENALVNWKIDRAVEGTAGDPALQARVVAAKPDDRATWRDIRESAINAGRGDQGADIGTAIHAMSERWEDPEDDFYPGDPYEQHLEAYSSELRRLGLISFAIECQMVNDEYRAAGTCDRLYVLDRPLITPEGDVLPVGTMVVGDLKTGKKLDFSAPGYSVQLAIYAGSQLYDVESDEYLSTPEINQRWGILVHMPSDRAECQMLWIDLEVGRWGAYLTQQVRLWRKNWRSGEFSLGDILSPDLAEMGEVVDIETADAEWVAEMIPYIEERLAQIKEHPDARKRLTILWPEHLHPKKLRGGELGVGEYVEAHRLIARIEAEFELGFVGTAPATEGQHKSVVIEATIPPSERQMALLPEEATQ